MQTILMFIICALCMFSAAEWAKIDNVAAACAFLSFGIGYAMLGWLFAG